MDTISSLTIILGLITTAITIILNTYILHEHKRKKFKAELESYEEYFQKYYLNDIESEKPLLIKDKAAQNLIRSNKFNAKLVNYFIELHEQKLLNFD